MIKLGVAGLIKYEYDEIKPGDKIIRFNFREAKSAEEYTKPVEEKYTFMKYSETMHRLHCTIDGTPKTDSMYFSHLGAVKQGIGFCLEKHRELFLLRYFTELQERILREKKHLEEFNGELATEVYRLKEGVYGEW